MITRCKSDKVASVAAKKTIAEKTDQAHAKKMKKLPMTGSSVMFVMAGIATFALCCLCHLQPNYRKMELGI